MNKNEFMQVIDRGSSKNIMDLIDNDKEYQEYRKAHPLPDRSNMTRAEKINHIVDLLVKLSEQAEQEKQEKEQREFKELETLLGYQCLSAELDNFYNTYIKRKRAAGEDPCFILMETFNYGVICGKRAERARRKGGAHND